MTPYLPVRYRHRKRETVEDFLAADVAAELGYRRPAAPPVTGVSSAEPTRRTGRIEFRRYRMTERLGSRGRAWPAAGVR